MPKQSADLSVVFAEGERAVKAATLVVKGTDLYTIAHNHRDVIETKHSYHASGANHYKTRILDQHLKPSHGRRKTPLASLTGYKFISNSGAGTPPALENYRIKPDKATRCTLVLPSPELPYGIAVWAVEAGQREVADRIAATPPYEKSVVAGTLLSDWTAPHVLVVVWKVTAIDAYMVVRYDPPVAGRVPYLIYPALYEGTWLADQFEGKLMPFEEELIERSKRERSAL